MNIHIYAHIPFVEEEDGAAVRRAAEAEAREVEQVYIRYNYM
jgi:hypothetical protein